MALRKRQLEKIRKHLDGACEALERLAENGIETEEHIDFSALVILKNTVEGMIDKKSRK